METEGINTIKKTKVNITKYLQKEKATKLWPIAEKFRNKLFVRGMIILIIAMIAILVVVIITMFVSEDFKNYIFIGGGIAVPGIIMVLGGSSRNKDEFISINAPAILITEDEIKEEVQKRIHNFPEQLKKMDTEEAEAREIIKENFQEKRKEFRKTQKNLEDLLKSF